MRPTEFTDDSLLTIQDLAKHLQVDTRTIQRLLVKGECPRPFVIGNLKRWRWATVKEWIKAVELLSSLGIGATKHDKQGQAATSDENGD